MEENQKLKTQFPFLEIAIISIIIIVAAVFVVNRNMSPSLTSDTASAITPTQEIIPTIDNNTDLQVKTINIEAGSYYFNPSVISLKKGDKVKIVINSVSMMHDFNIDELSVKLPIVKNGETGSVEFTADKVGTFEYYCSVGQHRQMGQVGKLIVEE